MGIRLRLAAVILFCSLLSLVARADSPVARLSLLEGTNAIPELKFERAQIPVDLSTRNGKRFASITLEGDFARSDSSLVLGDQILLKGFDHDRHFRLELPVTGPTTRLSFVAISPLGAVIHADYQLAIERYELVRDWLGGTSKPSPMRYAAGLSLSAIQYQQSGFGDLQQTALTLKAGVTYLFARVWEAGISGYGTLIPLFSDRPNTSARFVGVNFRTGRQFALGQSPWKLKVLAGYYYLTMFESPPTFGFSNLGGPEIYPYLDYTLNNGDHLGGYFKFAPVSDGFGIRSLSDRELAVGTSWTRPLEGNKALVVSLDVADFAVHVSSVTIHSTSVSMGVGFSF